jgi:hypothetical protein
LNIRYWFRAPRPILWSGLAAGLLFAGLIGTGRADAALIGCDTDPAIYLSDGSVVSLGIHIQDQVADLQGVTYVVHVPRDVRATNVVYDQLGSLESVQVVDDTHDAMYRVVTTVFTGAADVPLVINARVDGVSCRQSPRNRDGWSNVPVSVFVNCR